MKKLLYLFLVLPLIFSSCSKDDDDNTPTTVSGCTDDQATNYNQAATTNDGSCLYSINKVWEYDYWTYDGDNLLSVYPLVGLFIWEDDGIWATEVYDQYGYITDISSAGTFSMATNQETAIFTVEAYYDPIYMDWVLMTPEDYDVTINKLDGDEFDLSINYTDGTTEVIHTFESSTPLPPLGILNPDDNSHRKQLLEMLNELKERKK